MILLPFFPIAKWHNYKRGNRPMPRQGSQFQLTKKEFDNLKSQFAMSKIGLGIGSGMFKVAMCDLEKKNTKLSGLHS